jgi:hypothetical protein
MERVRSKTEVFINTKWDPGKLLDFGQWQPTISPSMLAE